MLLEPFAHAAPRVALEALTAEEARRHLPNAPHSIAEIVAHLDFWQSWFLARCHGQREPMADSAAAGWPPPGPWEELRDHFLAGLELAVELGDGADRPVDPPIEFPPLAQYTVREALAHVALHNAHHLGQVITLRQLMGLWPPPSGALTW